MLGVFLSLAILVPSLFQCEWSNELFVLVNTASFPFIGILVHHSEDQKPLVRAEILALFPFPELGFILCMA